MDLKQLIVMVKRWYWILILGIALGAAGGILYSRIQTPVYEATAKTLVMHAPDQSSSVLAYLSPDELATTFSQLILTQPVLDSVSNQLGVKVHKTQIQIQFVTNSQIIKVIVDDKDPQMSAKIANALVSTAIKQYVDLQIGLYVSSEKDVQTQLETIQGEIANLQTQITQASDKILSDQAAQIQSQMSPLQDQVSQLQQNIAKLTPATTDQQKAMTDQQKVSIAQMQAQINQIQPLLTAYQQAYTDLVVMKKPISTGSVDEENLALLEKNLEQYQQNVVNLASKLDTLQQAQTEGISNVIKIEDAATPTTYISPQVLMDTLLTTAVGFSLAVVAIFILENLGIRLEFPLRIMKRLKIKNLKDWITSQTRRQPTERA